MSVNEIEKELIKLMDEAAKEEEVPIAAIIIKNDKIISKKYNKVNSSNNILDHAEILAIKEASQKLNNWRLNDCDLYISLEPCLMCKEVIKMSRIKNVYYFAEQNNESINLNLELTYIKNELISKKIKDFFKKRR